jgi:hypothetical protein
MSGKKPLFGLLYSLTKFAGLVYYIATIFFRVCFLPEFDIYHSYVSLIIIDSLVDLFFIWHFLWKWMRKKKIHPVQLQVLQKQQEQQQLKQTETRQRSRLSQIKILTNKVHTSPSDQTSPINSISTSLSVDSSSVALNSSFFFCFGFSRFHSLYEFFNIILSFLEIFPFELLVFFSSAPTYYNYRCFRLIRIRYYLRYWNEIIEYFYDLKILITRPIQRLIFLMVTMAIVGHVFACSFYGMSLKVLETGYDNTWLVSDGLASLDSHNGEISFTKSVGYRYLRALYWSIQTLNTVGFGDVVPKNESETWLTILYFFIIAYLIYSCIANLMSIVAHMDSNKTKTVIKLSRFNQYATTRKLPIHLFQRARSYYDYQFDQLNGFDEQEVSFLGHLLGFQNLLARFHSSVLPPLSYFLDSR